MRVFHPQTAGLRGEFSGGSSTSTFRGETEAVDGGIRVTDGLKGFASLVWLPLSTVSLRGELRGGIRAVACRKIEQCETIEDGCAVVSGSEAVHRVWIVLALEVRL
jgi:hypothetical protein